MNQEKKSRIRLSYANVTATLALFVALGGSAYAATALPADSVGTRQIKPSAVQGSDIADGAVRGSDVADGTLRTTDFGKGEEPITKVVRRYGATVGIPAAHSADATVFCRKGERALGGGGVDLTGFHENFSLFASTPMVSGEGRVGNGDEPDGWEVRYYNRSDQSGGDSAIEVAAYVVCAR
jgi:hypothetical protein